MRGIVSGAGGEGCGEKKGSEISGGVHERLPGRQQHEEVMVGGGYSARRGASMRRRGRMRA